MSFSTFASSSNSPAAPEIGMRSSRFLALICAACLVIAATGRRAIVVTNQIRRNIAVRIAAALSASVKNNSRISVLHEPRETAI